MGEKEVFCIVKFSSFFSIFTAVSERVPSSQDIMILMGVEKVKELFNNLIPLSTKDKFFITILDHYPFLYSMFNQLLSWVDFLYVKLMKTRERKVSEEAPEIRSLSRSKTRFYFTYDRFSDFSNVHSTPWKHI